MSAKVWCRMGDGTEQEELHPTEEVANLSLTKILEKHRNKGHLVSEKFLEHERRLQFIVEDGNRRLVAMYQIVD